jgi:hypothetical protein
MSQTIELAASYQLAIAAILAMEPQLMILDSV